MLWLYFFLEALRLQFAGDYTGAFDLYRHCLDLEPNEAELYHQVGVYYADMSEDSLALDAFARAVELSPTNDAYLERHAKMLAQMQRYADATAEMERLYEHNRSRTDLLDMLDQLYRLQTDYVGVMRTLVRMEAVEGASEELSYAKIEVLQALMRERDVATTIMPTLPQVLDVMATAESDHALVSDMYAMAGDIFHLHGDRAEAYANYEKCLALNADNYSCLNNYSYFLALEGGDLKRAEEMSRRAVEANVDNATYLDTLAWVLYKRKRYAEAKVYMDRAMECADPTDDNTELLAHAEKINKKAK